MTADIGAAKMELIRRATQASFRKFFFAHRPDPEYKFGPHTIALLSTLQSATESVERGESRYIAFCMPPRHGKSDISSRRYPLWHLIRNSDHEVILASYNYQLATDMSFDVLRLLAKVGGVYGISVERDRGAVSAWRVRGHRGAMFSTGIGGTITGRGAHLLLIDDYLKNRQDAESKVIRDNVWESFQSDLMTRLAPAHAVVITANRWHEDDLVGRIKERNDPTSDMYDPDFPKFEIINYPAWAKDTGWLFPQRFSTQWYKGFKASQGSYAWQSLGLQDPRPRTGNLLRADMVRVIEPGDLPDDLRWIRGWDQASSEKERMKDDPDYTVGTLAAYCPKRDTIYVKEVARGQWAAPEKEARMIRCAERDGRGVMIRIEQVAGYKDNLENIKKKLRGFASVRAYIPTRDKVARASVLEPIFEAGNVCIVKGNWNAAWINEMSSFPGGKHDDQVDSLVIAVGQECTSSGRMSLSRL